MQTMQLTPILDNNAAVLNAQLNTAQTTLNTYLSMNDSLNNLLQNIRGLQSQLSRQPAENPSTLVDDLTALIMQINAFNTQVDVSFPDDPSRGRLKNTAIAMIIGLFLSIFDVFIFKYFHKPRVQISACV